MEDAYGIGITNRYDFLLDTESNDPQDILKEKAKKEKKAAKKKGKENAETVVKVDNKSDKIEEKKVTFVVGKGGKQSQPHQVQQQHQQQQPQKSQSMKDTQNIQENGNSENGFREIKNNFERDRNYRNNRSYDNREPRFNRRNYQGGSESSMENAGNRTSQENGFGYRGNRTNNGNRNNEFGNNNGQDIEYNQNLNLNSQRERDDDRPPRRQGNDRSFGNRRYDGQRRNYDGRGKREFDRQSGSDKTGVKATDKRDGGGAHNWGTHKQDMQDIEDSNKVPDMEPKDDGNSNGITKPEETVAVEEIQYTFDEYKKLQAERAKPPVYNLRKAGEGEDKKKWKNLVPLQKKEEVKSEDEYEFDHSLYLQRKRGIKYIVDIPVCFNEGKRPGFNNNRRRNRRDVDGRRNDDGKRQAAPPVDNRNFPSLG